MRQLFKTFNINQKMEKLQQYNFIDRDVAISIPMFDESHRVIKEQDLSLYWAQKQDASTLLHYIASIQAQGSKGVVHILCDGDEANETDRMFDYVILLHEFMAFEQSYVIEGLRENNNNLKIIEIC